MQTLRHETNGLDLDDRKGKKSKRNSKIARQNSGEESNNNYYDRARGQLTCFTEGDFDISGHKQYRSAYKQHKKTTVNRSHLSPSIAPNTQRNSDLEMFPIEKYESCSEDKVSSSNGGSGSGKNEGEVRLRQVYVSAQSEGKRDRKMANSSQNIVRFKKKRSNNGNHYNNYSQHHHPNRNFF